MSEHGEQVAFFDYLRWRANQLPELAYVFAVPNGAKLPYTGEGRERHSPEAQRLLAEGLTPGVPDICVPIPRGGYHGLWIEMKFGRNGLSDEQKKFQEFLLGQGYLVSVCYSTQEAIEVMELYLGVPARERTRMFGA
jgi:hypothetical protein